MWLKSSDLIDLPFWLAGLLCDGICAFGGPILHTQVLSTVAKVCRGTDHHQRMDALFARLKTKAFETKLRNIPEKVMHHAIWPQC